MEWWSYPDTVLDMLNTVLFTTCIKVIANYHLSQGSGSREDR